MARLRLYLDSRYERKNKMYPLCIYVNHRKHFYIRTGMECYKDGEVSEFRDGSIVNVKTKDYASANTTARNAKLHRLMAAVEAKVLDMEAAGSLARTDDSDLKLILEEVIRGRSPSHRTFVSYMEEFMATKEKPKTREVYESTIRKIRQYGLEGATYDTMTVQWLEGFRARMSVDGLKINTIGIHLRNIRTVFNWAISNEWTDCYPFRRFKIEHEQTEKRALTVHQMRRLMTCPCEPWQKRYVELFLLMVYLCGINATDLFHLTRKNLDTGRIVYRRSKTGKIISIAVPPEAQVLLDKYRGRKHLLFVMDDYSNYKDFLKRMNAALKRIGDGGRPLFPRLSSNVARHTFASLAAELDIPRETVANALGHTWADVTSIYIKYSQRKVDDAQRRVIDYIHGNNKSPT